MAAGLYDPRDFNDRLLLGLKGAMSEAELHILGNVAGPMAVSKGNDGTSSAASRAPTPRLSVD
jgi:hypothetical protein